MVADLRWNQCTDRRGSIACDQSVHGMCGALVRPVTCDVRIGRNGRGLRVSGVLPVRLLSGNGLSARMATDPALCLTFLHGLPCGCDGH